jgi:type IV secretion system protein VirD4
MIAPETTGRKKKRYRIPLGRKKSTSLAMGFQAALSDGKQTSTLLVAPAEKHLITIAPTGAGKFRSVLAPELLTYPGPVVCVDIKGEAYAVTARRRREMGQRVVRLDPFEVVGPSSDSLNFFDLFQLPNADLETDAQMISSILAGGASVSKDPFWDISAGGLVSGLIVYLAHHRDRAQQVLTSLRELVYGDDTDHRLAVLLDTCKSMHPMARGEIAAYLMHPERDTRPSVLSTVRSYFKALFSQRVEATFAESTFSLTEIATSEPISIYLILPPNKLQSHNRLIRLWVMTLMSAITCRREIPQWPTLFLMDEAAQLGHFSPLVQAITLGRGYGVRVHSFWQDLSQLMTCYPTEWRTIINNCGVKQVFGQTDAFMAAGLDELFQVSIKSLIGMGRKEQLLLRQQETVRATKLDYLKDRMFAGLFDPNPYYGGKWPIVPGMDEQCIPNNGISFNGISHCRRSDDDDDLPRGINHG